MPRSALDLLGFTDRTNIVRDFYNPTPAPSIVMQKTHECCQFVPVHTLEKFKENIGAIEGFDPKEKERITAILSRTLTHVNAKKTKIEINGSRTLAELKKPPKAAPVMQWKVYDSLDNADEGDDKAIADPAHYERNGVPFPDAQEALDGARLLYTFNAELFGWNSVDGRNGLVDSRVAFAENEGEGYDNAYYWNSKMYYGRGDGYAFGRFTPGDVPMHELSHGVTDFHLPHGLIYNGESGALNEHFSDAYAKLSWLYDLIKKNPQHTWKELVDDKIVDPYIGKDVVIPQQNGLTFALRNMEKPGTAYKDNPYLGDDEQPADYSAKYTGSADNRGVHINSGIFNKVVWEAIATLATKKDPLTAVKTVASIWWNASAKLPSNSSFKVFAKALLTLVSNRPYGRSSIEYAAIHNALNHVKIYV